MAFSSVSASNTPSHDSQSEVGVLVLSVGHALLYVNTPAHRLMQDLNEEHLDGSAQPLLPAPLVQLCHDLLASLGSPSLGWPNIQLQRCLTGKTMTIFARGIGLSDIVEPRQGKLMVILEVRPLPSQESSPLSAHSLTSREQNVVDGMAAGLTNKQIAAQLNLSEGTVKEYVKRIRMKVDCSSRGTVRTRIKKLHLDGQVYFSTEPSPLKEKTPPSS